jgi:hypothetical protein
MPKSNENQQAGVVVVFKPGVTVEQAQAALERLRDVIDVDYQYPSGMPRVQVFDPKWGGPVWYIP